MLREPSRETTSLHAAQDVVHVSRGGWGSDTGSVKMAWAGEILTHQVCENQATTLRISNKFLGVVSWLEHLAGCGKEWPGWGGSERG